MEPFNQVTNTLQLSKHIKNVGKLKDKAKGNKAYKQIKTNFNVYLIEIT